MSNAAITWAYKQRLPPGLKFTLVTLADAADHEFSCYPGQEKLAALTGQGVRSVRRHLEDLEARGFITRHRRAKKDGRRNSDRYTIHVQDQEWSNMGAQPETGEPTNRPNETGQPATMAGGQPATMAGNPLGLEPSVEPSVIEGSSPSDSHLCHVSAGNGFSEQANAEVKRDFQVSGKLPPDVPILEMVDVYHSIITSGARVKVLNQKRIGQLAARWRDMGRSIRAWAAFCHRVQASPFLTGQIASHGKEPFAALDIGWITGAENYVKILEGRFDGGKRESRNREVFDDFVARHT